jgi:hypothetical protein
MQEDPIVAEVHRIRQQLAAKYNFDVSAFFADVRKRQAALGGRLVRAEPPAQADRGRNSGSSDSTSSDSAPAA